MKILIIDDEQVSIFIALRMLSLNKLSGNVHAFLSAQEALNSIEKCLIKDVPDVILLDLNMPVMNGWEFLDALAPKWASLMNKCRIYVLTSSLDYLDKIRADEHPMISGLIHKPIKSEDIKLLLSQLKCM